MCNSNVPVEIVDFLMGFTAVFLTVIAIAGIAWLIAMRVADWWIGEE